MDDDEDISESRAELRRRTRRIGLLYAAAAPVVGAFFAVLFRPAYGVLLGALMLTLGAYIGLAYAPLAGWLRRREQSR